MGRGALFDSYVRVLECALDGKRCWVRYGVLVGVPPSSTSFLPDHLCEDMARSTELDNPQRHAMRAYSAAAAY